MSKKAVNTWEKERGVMFIGEVDLDSKVTADEFDDLMRTVMFKGVSHEDRIEYLKSKDIEVTRETMVDSSL